ncbi:MAG: hypothetical protein WAU70_14105 [Flavobacteriales bacterium]
MKYMKNALCAMLPALIACTVSAQEPNNCCPGQPRVPGPTVLPLTPVANPEAVTADLAIDAAQTSVTEDPTNWILKTRIYNQNGDDCASTCSRATIQLPTETKVMSVKTVHGTQVDRLRWKQCAALIEVDLPQLCPGATGGAVEITVVVEKSLQAVGQCLPTFTVSVRGDIPDTEPRNNYWWWMRRCGTTTTVLGPPTTGPTP